MMMAIAGVLCAAVVQGQGAGSTAEKEKPAKWVAVNPVDFHWKIKDTLPHKPSSAHAAIVWGDPQRDGYAFFGKFPGGFSVPLHWHSNDVLVVMTKNSMIITPEGGAPVEIAEGGFFSLPAKMKYGAKCTKECVFLVWGSKPFDIFYENPKDDPRNSAHSQREKQ
jgi:hypothetical protein